MTDEWVKKMWYIYTMEYYSSIKRDEIGSFVEMWMDLESVIQSEVSQKEKNKYCILTHICGIQKNDTDNPIFRAGIETQTQRTDMWTQWEREGVTNWEIRFDKNTLPCVKQIASGNLLYSTGSSPQCSVMTQMGGMGWRRSKREGIQVYIQLIHFIVQQKPTQHCKAILLQLKKK